MTARINTITENIYFVDLFCGAGGVTTGISMAKKKDGRVAARVIACVNHDENAILSHEANHPEVMHFTEDIRTLDITPIVELVKKIRANDPFAKIHLWASLECTNFSKAKGGLPRDQDSRTLANDLFRYVEALNPDHIWIENVREFMAWGPLDKNGKPLSRKNGKDYIRWCNRMQEYGYNFDWKILCCADYGDYTSRERYFAQFTKGNIHWPIKTHSRKPKTAGMFNPLKKWKPVKEVLDLDDYGQSIFTRKKPLVENTLKRIYAGLVKFVGKGEEGYMVQNYSGDPNHKVYGLDRPCRTITTIPHECVVRPAFIAASYGGGTEQRVHSLDRPSPTVTTQNRLHAVLIQYNGKPQHSVHSTDTPSKTLSTKDRLGLVQFFSMQYGEGGNKAGLDVPAWAITTKPKHYLTTCSYLMNPQYKSAGGSIDDPCFTLIARMDKRPPHIVTTEQGSGAIVIYEDDNETMKKIKLFMAAHGIADIYMRMLNIGELKRITGLPTGYVLYGTKTEQKKFIGNAVPTYIVKAMVEAYM